MSFQGNKFSEAVELLNSLEVTSSSQEKRRAGRTKLQFPLTITTNPNDKNPTWEKADLRDLSPRGMRITTSFAMDEGSSFAVQFPKQKDKPEPTPLICRVVHSYSQPDGKCMIGVEFTGRLTPPAEAANDDQDRIRKSILG
jgi:hypothetical protein